jgi:glutathionylspermidine synthase
MQPIKIVRRPHWQDHIRQHAYQADVLSDAQQQYWVEALPQPFAIQLSGPEETAIAQATESLWNMCVDFLDWFFTEEDNGDVDRRLAALQIQPAYWPALKNSWGRTQPVEDLSLCTRFDLAVTNDGRIKLLEINGDTPLLGAETVYQWNWYVDYLQNHQQSPYPLPTDANQFNEFWEAIAKQWRRIAQDYRLRQHGITFLVDENLEEDLEMAMQLMQILTDEVDPQIYTQIVYLRGLRDENGREVQRGLGLDDAGYLVDHRDDRIPVLWKMYDWTDLQNDMANDGNGQLLADRLATGEVKIMEPLWKQILANKGAMAMMWEQFQHTDCGEYLLATYFEDQHSAGATQLQGGQHVRKPLLGQEGVGISIWADAQASANESGPLEQKESYGYGAEGFILQEYIELPVADGYHYVVGSWAIDGAAAGLIIRGDTSKITGRHCTIIPHIVSNIEPAIW